jgi:hypothetical protein
MENASQEKEEQKKIGLGEKLMNFLAYGGFIIIVMLVAVIALIVDRLLK